MLWRNDCHGLWLASMPCIFQHTAVHTTTMPSTTKGMHLTG